MKAEHKHLAEQGVKLVELRLDYINGEVSLRRLIADRPCPVVVSCRRNCDGGKYAGTEDLDSLVDELWQDVEIDVIGLERIGVPSKANRLEPLAN